MEYARMLARLGVTHVLVRRTEAKILETQRRGLPPDKQQEQALTSYLAAYEDLLKDLSRVAHVEARRAVRIRQTPHLSFPIDVWMEAQTLTVEQVDQVDPGPPPVVVVSTCVRHQG